MIQLAALIGLLLGAPLGVQDAEERLDRILKDSEDRLRQGVTDLLRRELGKTALLTQVPFELISDKPFIPVRFLGGLVVTDAKVAVKGRAPLDARLVVDTGSRAGLILNRPFDETNRIAESLPRALVATIGGGIGGESRGRVGRLKQLRVGGVSIDRPVVICSTDRSGALSGRDFDGILGGPLLRKFKIIFDYAHRVMILEPNGHFAEPDEYDMSGLFLTAVGPDFRRFRVKSVMEGSPAAEADLRRDDLIVSVDGRPPARYTLETVRRLLRTPGRKVRLELLRGDRRFPVTLTLRRLI